MPLSEKNHRIILGLQSGHISDAMEGIGLTGSVLHGYTYLGLPGGRMAGSAYTVRQAPKHVTAKKNDSLVSHAKASGGLASSGEVIIVDAGGCVESGTWGENHCIRARPNGVQGAIINGATRDAHEIKSLDFPVFCKGFSPIKSRWGLETISHNETLNMDGVQVRSGDIVFGDETGIIIIPPELIEKILISAQKIRDEENLYAEQFK